MSSVDKITIAVVTYHNDFLLLERLLKSIYQYWQHDQIQEIKILLNDNPKYFSDLENVVNRSTTDAIKVDLICPRNSEHIEKFGDTSHISYDWFSQQLYKCLIAEVIDTEWFLIHDCKDYYTANVCINDCFTPDGKAIVHLDHHRHTPAGPPLCGVHWGFGPFQLAYSNSYDMFGLDVMDYTTRHFAFLTPFFAKTSIMREMVKVLRDRLQGIFKYLFSIHLDGQSFVTEFLLYSAYCAKLNDYADYQDWSFNHRHFYNCVSNSKDLRTEGHAVTSNPARNEE